MADLVPVDIPINLMCCVAWRKATKEYWKLKMKTWRVVSHETAQALHWSPSICDSRKKRGIGMRPFYFSFRFFWKLTMSHRRLTRSNFVSWAVYWIPLRAFLNLQKREVKKLSTESAYLYKKMNYTLRLLWRNTFSSDNEESQETN